MWLRFAGGAMAVALLACSCSVSGTQQPASARLKMCCAAVVIVFYFCLISGALAWNLSLAVAALALVVYVYRREGRSVGVRVSLGLLRTALIAFVLLLLNNPVLTRIRTLIEPSVVAVLVDVTQSMKVRDVQNGADTAGPSRLEAVVNLLDVRESPASASPGKSPHAAVFHLRPERPFAGRDAGSRRQARQKAEPAAENAWSPPCTSSKPTGSSTQVVPSIITVLDELAGPATGWRGRDHRWPRHAQPAAAGSLTRRSRAMACGSIRSPSDPISRRTTSKCSRWRCRTAHSRVTSSTYASIVRGTGYEPNHPVRLKLTDKRTGPSTAAALTGAASRRPSTFPTIARSSRNCCSSPQDVGSLEVKVEAEKQPGEVDEQDNVRTAQLSVLDARIAVLYVDGYPRWEYRYIKNEMIRDKTVDISCLLTSADQTFAQEGDPASRRLSRPDHAVPRKHRRADAVRRHPVRRCRSASVHRSPASAHLRLCFQGRAADSA